MAYENLIIERKVLVFNSVAIFKIVHVSLITTVPHTIINQLNNIQKILYMEGKKSKYKTFNSFKQHDAGLKDVVIFPKAISLQCS